TFRHQSEAFEIGDEVTVVDREDELALPVLGSEAPQAAFLFADVERAVARIGDAAFDLGWDHPRPQMLGQDPAARESQAVFLHRPFLKRGEGMDRLSIAAQAEAVALTLPARDRAEQGQRAAGLVHLPRPQHGVAGVVAVASDDDDTP